MEIPSPKWLKLSEIRSAAECFLREYHPSDSFPIPIETIIDATLGIDIIPLPGLKVAFDYDGFLSSDLKSIHVDEYMYEHYENRYRFTLAHELGHLVLHRYVYEACKIGCVDDFCSFNKAIGAKQKSDMEWQANAFAGYVLIPDNHMRKAWQKISSQILKMVDEAKENRIACDTYVEYVIARAAAMTHERALVSEEAMANRIRGWLKTQTPKLF